MEMEGEGRGEEQLEGVENQCAMVTKDRDDRGKGHDDEDHQQVKVNTVQMSTPNPVNKAVGNSEPGGGNLKEGKGEGLDLEGGKNSVSPALPDVGSEEEEGDVDGAVATTDGSASQVKEEFSIYKVPEEIWERILNEVKAAKDKAMCCQASTYFDMLLAKSKPIWQSRMLIAQVNEYLSETDTYKCRLVCKQWKEDIDARVARVESESQLYYPNIYGNYRNTFRSIEDIDRCLQKFDGHPANPFIDDGIVHLDWPLPRVNPHLDWPLPRVNRNPQEFVRKIFQLMEKFGKHIYSLRIRNLLVHPQLFYTILSRILINTPSLRELNISVYTLNVEAMQFRDGENEILIIDDDYIRELNDTIENGPLPYLPRLETLWFCPFPFLKSQATDSLHKAMMVPYTTGEKPQLKSLAFPMDCWQDSYAQGFGSLKYVNMLITCNDDLSKLLLVDNAPIEFMKLIVKSSAKIGFSTLIKVICKFPVEKLDLILHDGAEFVDDDGEAAGLIANMKSEKLWKLYISHGPKFSYNFLKIFPSLKTLRVDLYNPLEDYLGGRKESEEDAQLYKMMEGSQMYESNIWKLFPDLWRVEINHWNFPHGQFMPQYRFVGTRKYCISMVHNNITIVHCNKCSSQKVGYFSNFCTTISQKIVTFVALSLGAVILQRKFKIF